MNIINVPKGFTASGIASGIKVDGLDLGIIFSEVSAQAAGVFTKNKVKAAPVLLDMENIQSGSARAIVVNSGNANACTGPQGMEDAKQMVALTAEALSVSEEEVLVCSTGTIGKLLPMGCFIKGIPDAVGALEADAASFSQAIMTTDTRPKTATRKVRADGEEITLVGIAKGAGMIEPNMATMLCFIMTDAAIPAAELQSLLTRAVNESFNRITVDGDMSTNDTVLMLANGQSGAPANDAFVLALNDLCLDLALQIVRDGEGATKLVKN